MDSPPRSPEQSSPEPAAPSGAAAPLTPVVIPRWIQLVLLPLALLGLWALARAARTVVLILIIAALIALILSPLVKLLHQRGVPRGLAIFLSYLICFAALAGIGVLLATAIATQISHLQHNLPGIIKSANKDLADLQNFLNKNGIHVHLKSQGHTALQTLQKSVLKHSGAIVSFSRDLLSKLVTVAFDGVLVLVLSVYLLVYARDIGSIVRRIMPPGDGTPEDDYPTMVHHAVSGYVRGQLAFSTIMGVSAGIALTLCGLAGLFPDGKHYAVFFGGFYALMELIPYIGPILGAAPPVLVALFEHPLTGVWVILLFVLLQQLEGHFVAPQVFRISLRINPILVIVALLVGYALYGIAGALIALPVIAVLRTTVVYLRRHTVLEPWVVTAPGELAGRPPDGSPPPDRPPGNGAPTEEAESLEREPVSR